MPSALIAIQSPETGSTPSLAASVGRARPEPAEAKDEEAKSWTGSAPGWETRLNSPARRRVEALPALRRGRAVRRGVTRLTAGQ